MGSDPTADLPLCLRNLLDTLVRENGLTSWQIFGQNKGVMVKIRFGECQNGGQVAMDSGTNMVQYSKRSPSQMRRNARKAEERRITRQQAKEMVKDKSEIEMPRDDMSEPMIAPSDIISPIKVDPDSSVLPERQSPLVCGSPSTNGETYNGSNVGQAEPHNITTVQCDHPKPVCESTPGKTDTVNDTGSDSDDDEDSGKNLSFPHFRYCEVKPKNRKCSYCGAYKGRFAKVIMECPKDGRKICIRCAGENHLRHKKYLVECKSNFVNDADGYWTIEADGECKWTWNSLK